MRLLLTGGAVPPGLDPGRKRKGQRNSSRAKWSATPLTLSGGNDLGKDRAAHYDSLSACTSVTTCC